MGQILEKVTLTGDGRSTVNVLAEDASGHALLVTGTSVPSAVAGYAKSCLFFKTDATTGVKGLYENTGTTTSCSFNLIGDITAAEINANSITPIKMGTRTLVALSNGNATPTIAQLMTSSMFTMTPTAARMFTTPTAALIVAGITGATIGSWFDFTIVNLGTGANGITLTAGDAGVTLVGDPIVTPGSGTFRAILTNVTSSTEALSIYRMDGLSGVTATVAELNYLDIATLGTGAVSKAVVLDGSGNYIMPAAGIFGMSRGTLAAAGSGAADAAVITQQVTAVTGSDGTLAVALPAAAVATGPFLVINTVLTTGATLPVFPVNGGNDQINGGAEDAAFTMGPGQAAWFIPTSATQWYVADVSGVTSTKAELSILTGVTATAAEINAQCDISGIGQTITSAGAQVVTAGKKSVLLNNDSATIAATIADASLHAGWFVVKAGLEPGVGQDHTCTITTGSWDGTNKIATFADINDALVIFFDHVGNGTIISNTGSVALS